MPEHVEPCRRVLQVHGLDDERVDALVRARLDATDRDVVRRGDEGSSDDLRRRAARERRRDRGDGGGERDRESCADEVRCVAQGVTSAVSRSQIARWLSRSAVARSAL